VVAFFVLRDSPHCIEHAGVGLPRYNISTRIELRTHTHTAFTDILGPLYIFSSSARFCAACESLPHVSNCIMASLAKPSRKITGRLCECCREITIKTLAAEEGYSYFSSPAEMAKLYNKYDFCKYMFRMWAVDFIQD
jgi:hypothetical protein